MEILGFQFPGQALVSCWWAHLCWAKRRRSSAKWEHEYPFTYWGKTSSPHGPPNPATELPAEGPCTVIAGPGELQPLVWIILDKRLCPEFPQCGEGSSVAKVRMPLSVKNYPKHLATDIVLLDFMAKANQPSACPQQPEEGLPCLSSASLKKSIFIAACFS